MASSKNRWRHINPKNVVSEIKERYGEGKVTEEMCLNCGKKNPMLFKWGF